MIIDEGYLLSENPNKKIIKLSTSCGYFLKFDRNAPPLDNLDYPDFKGLTVFEGGLKNIKQRKINVKNLNPAFDSTVRAARHYNMTIIYDFTCLINDFSKGVQTSELIGNDHHALGYNYFVERLRLTYYTTKHRGFQKLICIPRFKDK